MNFLNADLLVLLVPMVALPLLVHLFNRHWPHAIAFPDLERIRRSLTERSRLARWRHILMTLLRTLIIALLLLVFLKPVLPRFGGKITYPGSKGRRVILVLDRALSMEHRGSGGTSAARNALVEAGKILATLSSQDSVGAIAAGVQPESLTPTMTAQFAEISRAIASLGPGTERPDLNKALALASTLLEAKGAPGEIYFLSDFQRSNWADVDFATCCAPPARFPEVSWPARCMGMVERPNV